MNSIETAVIRERDGHLLLGLTDGSVVDAGNVVGPAGATGQTGGPGLPGQRGAAVLSGPRPPSQDDGMEGDHWIDVSASEFAFYKKSGNGWTKLANLRHIIRPTAVAAGGPVGGQGSGGQQTSGTLPLANPSRLGQAKNLPDSSNLKTQSDFNGWAFGALESLAAGVSPDVDLGGYATEEYVDAADNELSERITAVENKPDPEPPNLSTYATKQDLSTATAALPYRIETDKVLRADKQNAFDDHIGELSTGGEIQLVDNLGYFSNIRFVGEHGVTTRSDQQGIIVDASELHSRIKTLEEQVETLVSLVPPVDYGEVTIEGGNDYQNGQCWLSPEEMGLFVCSLSGSQTHGCRYSWELMRGEGRFSGSVTQSSVTLICQSEPPNTMVLRCTVSHPSTEETAHGEITILVQPSD